MTPEATDAALRLVLLFYKPGWTHEDHIAWTNHLRTIEQATGRSIKNMPEATSRVLCDAVRAVLGGDK